MAVTIQQIAEKAGVSRGKKETEKCRRKEKDRDRNAAFGVFFHAGGKQGNSDRKKGIIF